MQLEKAWSKRVCRILVAQPGTARDQTSLYSRRTRLKWSFACSTSMANVNWSESHFLNTPTRSGTDICLKSDPPWFTDTAFTGHMSRKLVTDSILISFCSILTLVLTPVN